MGARADRTWWNERQPRFTLLVAAIYALFSLTVVSGIGGGDRIGLRGGGAGMYLLVIAVYGVIANVCYELIARSEALVKPKDLAAFRRRAFAAAVALGVLIPGLVGALL